MGERCIVFVFASAARVDFYIRCFLIGGSNVNAWLGKSSTIDAFNASENELSCLSRPMNGLIRDVP